MNISLSGFIGSGKNTVANILQENYGYKVISFSEVLKDTVAHLFSWDRVMLEGDTKESRDFRNTKDEYWSKILGYEVTPRKMMQIIGTELFQYHFHKNIWVHSLYKRHEHDINNGNIIFSDSRFKHEMDFVKSLNSKIIFVERNVPDWMSDVVDWYNGFLNVKPAILDVLHISEHEWLGQKPDYTIENKGNLNDLENNVKRMMEELA